MRTKLGVVAGCVFVMTVGGCGGGDDGGGGGGGGEAAGISFTPHNAVSLAGQAASCLDLFAQLTRTTAVLSERLSSASGSKIPGEVIALGDLGFCDTGEAAATWTDVDGDGAPSTGDLMNVELTACNGQADGTLGFTVVTAGDYPVAEMTVDLTIRDQVDGAIHTVTMAGSFRMQIEPAPPGTLGVRFFVPDKTVAAPGLLTTLNGKTACDIGCFDVYVALHTGDGSFQISYPLAVFKVPGQGIMTLGGWQMPAVEFDAAGVPQSGQLGLYPESSVLPCARLEISGGGVDSNDSQCTLTAASGGAITVAGKTAEGTPFTLQTTWDALR